MNVNKVFLAGRLVRDPDLKYTPSGTAIVSFSLATSRTWTPKDGEKKEETCFVDVTMFGRRAEVINEYFQKGSPVFIEGRLHFNQWEAKDGQKRNALRVIAENFEFIGGNQTAKKVKQGAGILTKDAEDIDEREIPF
ncbi:MAG TPA: single-stranded DNA-binding protein [Candidatus Scalindua sp.]|nr:single-stranded DNA-binding protein [Candidatus Scalindua sp.]